MNIRTVLNSIVRASHSRDTILSGETCVCVVGVGYVGESLLQQFGRIFRSIGFDTSAERTKALQKKYLGHGKIQIVSDSKILRKGTHFLVAVPTPLRDDHSINLSYVVSALKTIVSLARPGSCIIIESSIPVGTTRKLLGSYQNIFHCGMSPERIDPGRMSPPAREIPKIVSGLTRQSLKQVTRFYEAAYLNVVPVSKPEVAEMTKLHENCYRMVNIAYVNEISDACTSHGIDPHEMIQAAATKPFGFQPFHPGLGVGGHCLPVNPWYLFHNNKKLKVLELATKLMAERPRVQARRFYRKCRALEHSKNVGFSADPRILIVGLGFKDGQSNISHSPALTFARTLADLGCMRLAFYDPSITEEEVPWIEKLTESCWTSSYVDNKFDGVAWCNQIHSIDGTVLDKLQNAFFKSFVWQ